MNYNASIQSLSPITRRGMLLLVAILTLTSVRVQAAQASRYCRTFRFGFRSPWLPRRHRNAVLLCRIESTGRLKVLPINRKKIWNKINAPDIETLPEYSSEQAIRSMSVASTAYTSDPAETDSSPFTTANGSQVRDGIVAANFLPFRNSHPYSGIFRRQSFRSSRPHERALYLPRRPLDAYENRGTQLGYPNNQNRSFG